MKLQPASLEPKASATATSAMPQTRDATPWPNTVLASTKLFVATSWPILPNRNEITAPAILKMKRPNAENAPPKQAAISHPMVLGNSAPNNNNMSLPNVPSEELYRWGPQCPVCAQSTPNPKQKGFQLGEKRLGWRHTEGKKGRKAKKEDKMRIKLTAEQCTDNYYPLSPQYKPSYKETPLNIQVRPSHHYKTEEGRKERLEVLNEIQFRLLIRI